MGLYDRPSILPYLRYAVLVLLLLVDVWLFLPSPYRMELSFDREYVVRGGEGILWLKLVNTSGSPLDATSVAVQSLAPGVYVSPSFVLVDPLPPHGSRTLRIGIRVEGNVAVGDQPLRVFWSLPGETRVVYVSVKVS